MLAQQLHILGQPLGLGPFGRPFGVGDEDGDEVRTLVAIDHRLQYFGLERQHPLDALRRDIVALVVDDQVLLRSVMTMRSEEHTSELQSLMRTSYAVFCWKKTRIALMITYSKIATL